MSAGQGFKKVAVAGIGETEYVRWGKATRSELELACEAIAKAAADAGIAVSEIDGVASYALDRNEPQMLQDALGLDALRFASMVWGGGGTGSCGALLHAAMAVEQGLATNVVVIRALCQGQSRRYGQFTQGRYQGNFFAPFGMFAPPFMVAPLVQRYMYEYGIKQEQLGAFAISCRHHALRNPRAVLGKKPLTMEEYLSSRIIASPLRLYDCTQENDGACALLVTTVERARDLKQRPVRILAAAQANEKGWGAGALGSHNMPIDTYGSGNGRPCAEAVYGRAGVKPSDIDVAQFYDHFTGLVLMQIENFGFCGRGEGGAFVEAGNTRWPDGAVPMNTAGGHLSEAYIHGLNHAVEAVRQLRGASTSQVKDAELCLVTAGLGGALTSAAIFGV